MSGEQEYHICLYRFSFSLHIKFRLVRGRLYLPLTTYKSTTESATLRQLNSGLPKYISNFPYFTGFPAYSLVK